MCFKVKILCTIETLRSFNLAPKGIVLKNELAIIQNSDHLALVALIAH